MGYLHMNWLPIGPGLRADFLQPLPFLWGEVAQNNGLFPAAEWVWWPFQKHNRRKTASLCIRRAERLRDIHSATYVHLQQKDEQSDRTLPIQSSFLKTAPIRCETSWTSRNCSKYAEQSLIWHTNQGLMDCMELMKAAVKYAWQRHKRDSSTNKTRRVARNFRYVLVMKHNSMARRKLHSHTIRLKRVLRRSMTNYCHEAWSFLVRGDQLDTVFINEESIVNRVAIDKMTQI